MNHHTKKTASKASDISSDYQFRYTTIKTLAIFKQSLEEQDRQMAELIEEAKRVKKAGNEELYQSVRKKLRLCLVNKKLLDEMSARLELSLQLDAMDRMVESYNNCMDMMKSRDLLAANTQRANAHHNDRKKNMDRALRNCADLYNDLIETHGEDTDSGLEQIVSDERLEEILFAAEENGVEYRDSVDDIINDKIQSIKRKMEGV